MTLTPQHTPVLLDEMLEFLRPAPGAVFVDATVGAGGHAAAIAGKIMPGGRLIGLDRDRLALEIAGERLAPFGASVTLIHSRLDALDRTLAAERIERVDGILIDLGVSSMQLDNADRGFSFSRSGPLDMRMDRLSGKTAAERIAQASVQELTDIFYRYGEERWSKRIAERIVEHRAQRAIVDTKQLADIVAGAIPRGAWQKGLHPATRIFQALRIAVNDELDQIEPAIRQGVDRLKTGGRIGIIAFHSLEDRIVKRTLARLEGQCTCPPRLPVCGCGAVATVKLVTRKPLTPSEEEVQRNPRARSARLRVAERV